MHRIALSIIPLVPVLLLAACTDEPQPTALGDARHETSEASVASGLPGDSLPWLTPQEAHMFRRGKYLFQKQFNNETGLGPTFNARSCAQCHGDESEGVGGIIGGTGNDVETHFTRLNADSSCSSLALVGGVVKQDLVMRQLRLSTGFTTEPLPTGSHQTAHRMTPDLFGFGLIAAIPEAAILARHDPDDADGDGISGRAHMVGGVLGRFGRKAAGTDLDHFNAGAYLHEMGITTAFVQAGSTPFMQENRVGSWVVPAASQDSGSVDRTFEPELASEVLDSVNAFVRFLAPPPSTVPTSDDELAGQALFTSIGCNKCHTPEEYTTVSSSFQSLNGKQVRPFSDFLLHEMGPQLAPGDICLVHAGRTEFRTEPLMGSRFMNAFMHDGLAATVDQAIFQHGGEAAAARDAYSNLPAVQRQKLLAYINTL
jgi:CxxC motif-containing protein (DUF1111 family)